MLLAEIKCSLLHMSVFVFYAEVNMACICILLLLLFSIRSLPTPQLKDELFRKLVLWHIIYFLNDTVWALVNDGIFVKNAISVLAVNYLNAIIAAVVMYSCFLFAEFSTRPDMTLPQIRRLKTALRLPVFVEAVVLLVFFVLHPNFWLDEDLESCNLYYLIFIFCLKTYRFCANMNHLKNRITANK